MEIKLIITFAWILFFVMPLALFAAYWFLLRPIMNKVPAAPDVTTAAAAPEGPAQGWLDRFKGWRTIIAARAQMAGGVLVGIVTALYQGVAPLFDNGTIDWRSLIPAAWTPWAVALVLIGFGILHEKLRTLTTGPVPAGDQN